ncbi:MAG: porin OmpL1 [Spirochaetota bacterium]
MKKLLVVMLAMAVAIGFGSMAMAKDGLSVDLGFAWNFNGADMGKTIMKDGEEGAANGLFGDVIVAENELLSLSKYKAGGVAPLISSVTDDGVMSGINTALRVRYDFLNSFFARVGFVYDMQLMGGDDKFKITTSPVLTAYLNNTVGVELTNSQLIANSLAGQTVTQKWTYGYWAIPVTVGINIPINEGKYNVYAGIGLTYYSGYWQIEAKAPAGYILYDEDGNKTLEYSDTQTTGAVNEKLKFEASGIGFNWTLGASAEVIQDLSIFIELDATYAGGMSDSIKLKSNAGKRAFPVDNIHYPVNLSTQLLRFGVNYRLPVAL